MRTLWLFHSRDCLWQQKWGDYALARSCLLFRSFLSLFWKGREREKRRRKIVGHKLFVKLWTDVWNVQEFSSSVIVQSLSQLQEIFFAPCDTIFSHFFQMYCCAVQPPQEPPVPHHQRLEEDGHLPGLLRRRKVKRTAQESFNGIH